MAARKKKASKKHGKKRRSKKAQKKTTRRKSKAQKHEHVKMSDISKRARGKRWTCGGPIRSGCGGSKSRVIGKMR